MPLKMERISVPSPQAGISSPAISTGWPSSLCSSIAYSIDALAIQQWGLAGLNQGYRSRRRQWYHGVEKVEKRQH